MSKDLKAIARSFIPAPEMVEQVRHEDGNTMDIIETILYADRAGGFAAAKSMQQVADQLWNPDPVKMLKDIWSFVKSNIRYKADQPGHEKIKSPARLWADGVGDCKSFSLMLGSILRNYKEIGYSYRFVIYPGQNDYTHVYVIAHTGSRDYILDSVHSKFNDEVKYKKKLDINMTKISHMTGTPAVIGNAKPSRTERFLDAPLKVANFAPIEAKGLTDGQLSLALIDRSLQIDAAYFGDPTGEIQQARNLIYKAQKEGVHNFSSFNGIIPSGIIRDVAALITIYRGNRSAAISGPDPGDLYYKKECAEKFPISKFIESTSGGFYPLKTRRPDPTDPNYGKYMECYKVGLAGSKIFETEGYIQGSMHMLYEFLESGGSSTQKTKKVFHYNAITGWANVSGISRENVRLFTANGIKLTNAKNKLPDLTPTYNIELLKIAANNRNEIPGIKLDPVTIAAAAKLVGAIATAVIGILGAIRGLSALNQASLRASAQGIGAPGFGPEINDIEQDISSSESINSLIPWAAAAAGAFILIK